MSDTATQSFDYAKNVYRDVGIELAKEYKKALDNIRVQLSKLNEKGVLTQSDMLKFGRLENLKTLIESEMVDITKGTYKIINSSRVKTFYNSYKLFFEQSGLSMPKLNTDFIKSVLANPLYETKFKDSLADLTKVSAKKINDIIAKNLIQGNTIASIAKEIKQSIEEYSVNHAKLIARQETLRALTEGQLSATDKLIQKGFNVVKVWIYNHSPKQPREYHQDMDGQEADEDGNFHIQSPEGEIITTAPRMSGIASNDINCVCSYYNDIRS